ncbi:AraC family transcriptional regulator [Amycolatopsis sp. NPDC023774]|uniref:helix-turn-helix transcriptional regulator n=1 Tax=Amycolatopsis sp. NPDC023774 TaxID=3155015 RepID=UPI0033E6F236
MHSLRSAEQLEQAAGQSYVPIVAERRADFRGRLALQAVGQDLTLAEARMSPLQTSRTARLAATTGRDDLLLFCLHLAGTGRLSQHDRCADLGAGVGVLYESGSPWDLTATTDVHTLLLQFPRSALPVRPTVLTDGLARQMAPQWPAVQLLSGYLDGLFRFAPVLTPEQRHDAGAASLDLLAMVLRGMAPAAPAGPAAGAVLLEMLRAHVHEHFSDPRLTVAELARRHHLSVRHVHTLFADLGTTPGAYLRRHRLHAATGLLTGARPVADVGTAVGMPELRTFERAFRREFGTTPARWRNAF